MTARVLVVTADPEGMPGGGAAVAERLICGLGVEALHLRPGSSAPDRVRPVGWSLLGRSQWAYYLPLGPGGRRQAIKILDQFAPTAVLANGFGHPFVDWVARASLDRGLQTVIVCHGLPSVRTQSRPLRSLIKIYLVRQQRLLQEADAVTCPTDDVAEEMRGLNPGEIIVIPWGTDGVRSEGPERQEKSRFPILITVARIVPLKRLEILIRTMSVLRATWPEARLDIVGPIGSPRYAKSLNLITQEFGLMDTVNMTGPLSGLEYQEALRAAHIYVSASRQESFGLAMLEASAAGLPLVSTEVGISRRIVNARNGRLLPVDAGSEDFARAVADILVDYPRAAAEAERTAIRIGADFAWSRSVAQFAALLSDTRSRR